MGIKADNDIQQHLDLKINIIIRPSLVVVFLLEWFKMGAADGDSFIGQFRSLTIENIRFMWANCVWSRQCQRSL
jgi:hypothetical protein